jgi:hypothetical protein
MEHMSIKKQGLPKHAESLPTTQPFGKMTTLPNGLKVATITSEHPVSSVGIFVRAGSRREGPDNAGISFYLRQLGFLVLFLFFCNIICVLSFLFLNFQISFYSRMLTSLIHFKLCINQKKKKQKKNKFIY